MTLVQRFLEWCSERGISESDRQGNYVNFGLDQNLSVEDMRQFLDEVRDDS